MNKRSMLMAMVLSLLPAHALAAGNIDPFFPPPPAVAAPDAPMIGIKGQGMGGDEGAPLVEAFLKSEDPIATQDAIEEAGGTVRMVKLLQW